MIHIKNRQYSRFRIDTLHRSHVVGRDIPPFVGRYSTHCQSIPPIPGALVNDFQHVPGVKAQVLLGTSRVIVQGHKELSSGGRVSWRPHDLRVRLRGRSRICQNCGPLLFIAPGLRRLFKTRQKGVPACGNSLLDLHLVNHSCELRVGEIDRNISFGIQNVYQIILMVRDTLRDVALQSPPKKNHLHLYLRLTTCASTCRCTWRSSTPTSEWGVTIHAQPREQIKIKYLYQSLSSLECLSFNQIRN